jgi:hypothetical protein
MSDNDRDSGSGEPELERLTCEDFDDDPSSVRPNQIPAGKRDYVINWGSNEPEHDAASYILPGHIPAAGRTARHIRAGEHRGRILGRWFFNYDRIGNNDDLFRRCWSLPAGHGGWASLFSKVRVAW